MADNAKWYVAHTYSGYENAVKAAIEKSVVNRGMEDMVLKTEIPMETVTEVTETGVMKEVQRKVFPGYVLIKMVMTDDTWHLIRNIRGVTGFVGEANKAIPLTEDEVAALGMEKLVLSAMPPPSSRIWGRTKRTRNMDRMVPRPRLWPMPAMAASEVICPMRVPATVRMLPEVITVGKAKFSASIMASLWLMDPLISW